VEDLEERFFKGDFDQADIGSLYELKRDLVELRRAAAPLVEVCNYLLTDVFNNHISDDIRPYFRDVTTIPCASTKPIDSSGKPWRSPCKSVCRSVRPARTTRPSGWPAGARCWRPRPWCSASTA
jgi:hypothetical protein